MMPNYDVLPWNFWLKFRNLDEERAYMNQTLRVWVKIDFWSRIFISCVGLLMSDRVCPTPPGTQFRLKFIASISLSLILNGIIVVRPEWYTKHRTVAVLLPRVAMPLVLALNTAQCGLSKARPVLGNIVAWLVIRSPIMPLIYSGLTIRLQFQTFAVVHTIACLLSAVWITADCAVVEASESLSHVMLEIAVWIDRLMTMTWSIDVSVPDVYPGADRAFGTCLCVTGFLHFALAFWMTTVVIYVNETSSRVAYFLQGRPQNNDSAMKEYKTLVGWLAFVTSLMTLQAVWVILWRFTM